METIIVFLKENITTEWLWTALGFLGMVITFIVGMRTSNRLSTNDFIYRINSDFANNEKILDAYKWLDKCRKENKFTHNYRRIKGVLGKRNKVDFTTIDTYSNHFESVYVIRKVISMKTIDRLFQQRFLYFMHNSYVQKEMFFHDYEAYENLFLLLKEWIKVSIKRHGRNWMIMSDYLRQFTCGDYEYRYNKQYYDSLSWIYKIRQNSKYIEGIIEYVPSICNPKCRYGYYSLSKRNNNQSLVVRIIQSVETDIDDIIALQDDVHKNMKNREWYFPYSQCELQNAIHDRKCILLQIDVGSKIAAFAVVILAPKDKYRLSKLVNIKSNRNKEAVLETVFVADEYRGYGMQSLLIDIMCHLAALRGATSFWASVHPDNKYSSNNIIKNGFTKKNSGPVPKYDGVRDIYCRNIKGLKMKEKRTGESYYYPY